jgi:hypothetical protein
MSKPSVLIRKSTGEILKHCPYPKEDMSEVEGLDPDLEYLVKHEPFQSPDYDPRIFELEVEEALTQEPHPEHPHLNVYKKTYKTKKRPNEDIIRQIENAEESANRELLDYRTDEKLFMLAIGILTRINAGVQPSAKEQEILDKVMAYDVPIWKNDTEKEKKKQQVLDGIEPEIDAGWQRTK